MRLSYRIPSLLSLLAIAAGAAALSSLTGCSAGLLSTARPVTGAGMSLSGSVHGGQQPVSGSNIYLMAAGTTGYGAASISLLNPASNGVLVDGNGRGYVTTDAGGRWTITGDYTCSANDQLYVLVTGGNPGLSGTVNNTAIAMINALGSCSSISASTFVIVNEITTVAAVTALQQFMTDATHVGSTSTNAKGIQNAFLTAKNMVGTAETVAWSKTPAGNGTVPQTTIHTLGNALAACINTSSNGSVTCGSLFAASGPTLPTDTVGAMLNIALNPGYRPTTIFNLASGSPPFLPALSAAPKDFSLGVTYALGGTPEPGFLAIDVDGNVWATNRASEKSPYTASDSIVELSPVGAVLSGANGYTAGGIYLPEGIAIDLDGHSLWVANSPGSVVKLTSSGALVNGFPVSAGNYPQGIAIDTGGNAWVSNSQGNDVMEISGAGAVVKSGITAPNFSAPQGVAIDYNGNIYIASQGASSVMKLSAAGTVLSSGAGFTGAGLNAPSGVAVDNSARIWAVNTQFSFTTGQQTAPASFSVLKNTGAAVTGSSGYGSGAAGVANIVAIDGAGSAWTALCTTKCVGGSVPNAVVEVSAAGTVLSPASGFTNVAFDAPQAVAVDASGNVWVANSAGQSNGTAGSITQLVGVAAPVKTPLVNALSGLNLVGIRP